MKDESLDILLRGADEAVRPPHVAELAARVRRADRRRRISTRAAAVVVVGAIIAAVFTMRMPRPARVVVRSPDESAAQRIAVLRGEALQLASDAAVHERVADALLRLRRRSDSTTRWERAISGGDPLEDIREKRDRAAEILVRGAERIEAQPDSAGRAAELYRQTARLFGDTAAGREAARRAKTLGA